MDKDKDKKKEKELDIRLRKLEDRFKDLRDSNDENTSSIEDLYDTINNFKSKGYNSSNQSSSLDSSSESSLESGHQYRTRQGDINKTGIIKSIIAQNPDSELIRNELEIVLDYLANISPRENISQYLEYFIQLPEHTRTTILASLPKPIDCKTRPPIFTILESPLSDYHKQIAIHKLHMLEQMDSTDAEYYKLKQWLDNLLAIPFGIYKEPAFIVTNATNAPKTNAPKTTTITVIEVLQQARTQLDNAIYGQQKTKQHIMEIVARMITNPSSRGTVFAVEGSAGVGKTSLIKKGLAPIFNLPFQFISLGGARDMAYLAGENYTYIGSKPGLIVQAIKKAGCMNPIFYFDELDKVSNTLQGQEIINLLIHITDPAQNEHFQDMYMDGIPVDLSRALFIFSFNNRALINPILLDRMEIIKFHKYTYQDKAVIIEKYLLPELVNEYFGSSGSGSDGGNGVEVILEDKPRLLEKLINIRRIGNGVGIGKVVKSRMCGIRSIRRKLGKAIARINLAELSKTHNTRNDNANRSVKNKNSNKKRKIVIKPIDVE